jgi:3-oxoadipate enol-lactonase
MGIQKNTWLYVVLGITLAVLPQAAPAAGQAPVVKSGFVDIGTAKLAYDEAGRGDAVILIHGGLLTKEMWDGTFEKLARSYRVVRYDARNHGRSRSEKGDFFHFKDLDALMDGLHIEKAVIMGLSMGGYVATDFVLRHPDKVSGLILVAPGLSGYDFHGPEFEAFIERHNAAAASGDKDKVAEAFMEAWVYGPKRKAGDLPQDLRDKVRGMIRRSMEALNDEAVEYRPIPLAAGRLGEIQAPTLAIVGDLDMPGILEIVDLLGKNVPDFEKVVIPGVAHMIPLEKPAEFDAAVSAFLKKIYGH